MEKKYQTIVGKITYIKNTQSGKISTYIIQTEENKKVNLIYHSIRSSNKTGDPIIIGKTFLFEYNTTQSEYNGNIQLTRWIISVKNLEEKKQIMNRNGFDSELSLKQTCLNNTVKLAEIKANLLISGKSNKEADEIIEQCLSKYPTILNPLLGIKDKLNPEMEKVSESVDPIEIESEEIESEEIEEHNYF